MPRNLLTRKQKRAIPESPGVYHLYMGMKKVYTGGTSNLRQRISGHNLRGLFDRVKIEPCSAEHVWEKERKALDYDWESGKARKPKYNKNSGMARFIPKGTPRFCHAQIHLANLYHHVRALVDGDVYTVCGRRFYMWRAEVTESPSSNLTECSKCISIRDKRLARRRAA
jgi:hypothetical protein